MIENWPHQKWDILIQNTILQNFQNSKIKFKKDPLKFQKHKNSYKEQSNQKVIENRPPPPKKWVFWFQIQFQNFQNSKTKLKKDPLKMKINAS